MKTVKSLIATAAIAAGMSLFAAPGTAQAQNAIVDVARVIVNASDIVYRNDVPYYRYGNYGARRIASSWSAKAAVTVITAMRHAALPMVTTARSQATTSA